MKNEPPPPTRSIERWSVRGGFKNELTMNDIIRAMHPDTYYTPIGAWVEIISKTEDYLPFENPKFIEQ